MDIWSFVKEDFTEKLARRTAIMVKEEDYSVSFAYPSDFGSIGWLFDYRQGTTYQERPAFSLRFAEYTHCPPQPSGSGLNRSIQYFETMEYYPSLAKRKVVFGNLGIEADETFSQGTGGNAYLWDFDILCKCHEPHDFDKKLFTIAAFAEPVRISVKGNKIALKSKDRTVYIVSEFSACALYSKIDDYLSDMGKGKIKTRAKQGKYVVIEHIVKIKQQEKAKIRFGISTVSDKNAAASYNSKNAEKQIQAKWNKWFNSLAHPKFENDADKKAFYKCWWVIRNNNYNDPKIGKAILEALPVYRGYWQWALPAMEWQSEFNPEVGPSFAKNVINFFMRFQRDDGFITHAIYLTEKNPLDGGWAKQSIVQTPHVPWVCLRYYYRTKDIKSLKEWYPKLKKYYNYLCESRDKNFRNLHLWAITTSYDTGLDTTSAFQRVTFGEKGKKEKYLYASIFSAERFRYEYTMGIIAKILKSGDEDKWFAEAKITQWQMDKILWDKKKNWYGALHEDGTLDTRVGVDGLFPFAYNMVNADKADKAKNNFKRLIGVYGVHSVAPGEKDFSAENYWRGPAWSKPCSVAMAAANYYYPELLKTVKDSLVRFLNKQPSVWECLNAKTGKVCRGDVGFMATPQVSSNVGAGEAMGALWTYYGRDMFDIENNIKNWRK